MRLLDFLNNERPGFLIICRILMDVSRILRTNPSDSPYPYKIQINNVYIRMDWKTVAEELFKTSNDEFKYGKACGSINSTEAHAELKKENPDYDPVRYGSVHDQSTDKNRYESYRLVHFGNELNVPIKESKTNHPNKQTLSPYDVPPSSKPEVINTWRLTILAWEIWTATSFHDLPVPDQWNIISGNPVNDPSAERAQNLGKLMPEALSCGENSGPWWENINFVLDARYLDALYENARSVALSEFSQIKDMAKEEKNKGQNNKSEKWELIYKKQISRIEDYHSLQIGDLVGGGAYSHVYRGVWSGLLIAIKKIKADKINDYDFKREAEIVMKIQCEHVVQVHAIYKGDEGALIVMEHISGGSLKDLLDSKILSDDREKLSIGLRSAQGLAYLHLMKIIHGDIKSANILRDALGNPKICDFGAAYDLNTPESKPSHNGTIAWKAPELFADGALPTMEADVYSFGMLLLELMSGKVLDAEDLGIEIAIEDKTLEQLIPTPECVIKDIINKCRNPNPKERITMPEVVQALTERLKTLEALEKPHPLDFDQKKLNEAQRNKQVLIKTPFTPEEKKALQEIYDLRPVPNFRIDYEASRRLHVPALAQQFNTQVDIFNNQESKPTIFADQDKHRTLNEFRKKVQTIERVDPKTAKKLLIQLFLLWHGTSNPDIIDSICSTGYINRATTDPGWYGNGCYFTDYPEYASIYGPHLILNLVSAKQIHVINESMWKALHYGKANYNNSDAHLIEVVPEFDTPGNMSYVPPACVKNRYHLRKYMEFVIFASSQACPVASVVLTPMLLKQVVVSVKNFIPSLILNGHGTKTNRSFDLKSLGHTLITPDSLKNSYVLAVDPSYSIEANVQKMPLPLKNGLWTIYQEEKEVPDVQLDPWSVNELTSFAPRILAEGLWKEIDGNAKCYLDRDSQARLVIKKDKTYKYLQGKELKDFFIKVKDGKYNPAVDGVALFLYAKTVKKIKILSKTSTSEVLTQLSQFAPQQTVLLASCNHGSMSKEISLVTKGNELVVKENKLSFGML